jgi:hypothetical protein
MGMGSEEVLDSSDSANEGMGFSFLEVKMLQVSCR